MAPQHQYTDPDSRKWDCGINPVEYGRLLSKVDKLEHEMAALHDDVKMLLEIINRSKGALWLGISIAAGFGAFVTWVVQYFKDGSLP